MLSNFGSLPRSSSRSNKNKLQLFSANHVILYSCVLVSGAAGLIYEVVWARYLSLFLGITTYAHTAVLTAFMVGLAAGSYFIGRQSSKITRPLRLYGWLEIGIGLYAAITPWLVLFLQSIYTQLTPALGLTGLLAQLTRFFLAFLGLLIPTFFMGGTLPLLIQGLTQQRDQLTQNTGRLYGINTFGAALGSFLAGYILLPTLGMRNTIFFTVGLNVGVGLLILYLYKPVKHPLPTRDAKAKTKQQSSQPIQLTTTQSRLLIIAFALSGFAALIYEVAWIRALTLVIGSSVYAFSTTLATYLAGIGLGSLLYTRLAKKAEGSNRVLFNSKDANGRLRQIALLLFGIAFSAIVGLGVMTLLPKWFLRAYASGLHNSFILFQAFIFLLCFAIMLLPTLIMGGMFPLIINLWSSQSQSVGQTVGSAYAANTVGTIGGAVAGGLLFLPNLGIQGSIYTAVAISSSIATILWFAASEKTRPFFRQLLAPLTAVGAILLAIWLLPGWNQSLMSSGVFFNPDRWLTQEGTINSTLSQTERSTLYYKEGIDGIVSVVESGTQRLLVINGKTDASSKSDLPTQMMVGHLPLLIHPNPQNTLVIGLGSGITAGSAATHSSISNLDVLEISPEVVTASSYFRSENNDVLNDPRLNLIVADARNFVIADTTPYDVIISEPSNPWISGISNLFTQEFFQMAAARLAPDGIMTQWVQTYSMSTEDLQTVLHTFHTVFPHVSIWMPLSGDLILVGSNQPHNINYQRLQQLLAQPAIQTNLAQINMTTAADIMNLLVAQNDQLDLFLEDAKLNTDDRPYIEFSAPRNLYSQTANSNLIVLIDSLSQNKFSAPVDGLLIEQDGHVFIPELNLQITHSHPEEITAVWLVERQLVSSETAVPQLGISNQLLVNWQADNGETQLLANRVSTPLTAAQQQTLLTNIMVEGIYQGGEITFPGNHEGLWSIGPSAFPDQIAIGAIWSCPDSKTGATITNIALTYQPNIGPNQWETQLLDFVTQFQCGPIN